MTKRRKPTQADLDAANAEVGDLMNKVRILEESQASAEQDQKRRDEDAFIAWWSNTIGSCEIPSQTLLSAAVIRNGKTFCMYVGIDDLRRFTDIMLRRHFFKPPR